MKYDEQKRLIQKVFRKIKNTSITIGDLKKLLKTEPLKSNKMPEMHYPKINFTISKVEIEKLIESKILKEKEDGFEWNFHTGTMNAEVKLLYALAWKNGDLIKLHHIIRGIQGDESVKKKGEVFHQFGKHLANRKIEPIVDQHVIRAFMFNQELNKKSNIDEKKIEKILNSEKVKSDQIEQYKIWFNEILKSKKKKDEYMYHIDQILFATGKAIKLPRKEKKKISSIPT